MITRRLHIGGMTCINCQNRIQAALNRLPGVKNVSVSYETGVARFSFDPEIISPEQIQSAIADLGYDPLPEKQTDMIRTICLPAIIIALYILLERFGLLNLLVPGQLAEGGMGYGMLFMVGLLTSVHCIAMCGGISLSQCLPGGERRGSPLRPALAYNAGRVTSYTVLGFMLGLAGMALGGGSSAGLPIWIQGMLKILAGGAMVIMGVRMLGVFPVLRRLKLRLPGSLSARIGRGKAGRRPFIVGLFNGLMPCGPLQSMQILALASGNPIAGALSMLMFSLGTAPLMLGLGAIISALGRRFARTVMNIGSVLVTVLGLAMLSQGGSLSGMLLPDRLLLLIIGLTAVGIAASIPVSRKLRRACAVAAALALTLSAGAAWRHLNPGNAASQRADVRIADGVQLAESTLLPGRYPSITVQAGLPVRWIIDAPEGSINGCNYKLFIPEYDIEYAFRDGENIIEFMPTEPGTYSYSCWMGMIRGSIIVM